MKIIIPTNDKRGLDSIAAEHFGRCNTYTLLDEKGNVIDMIDNTSRHMGGAGLPPELMKEHGADILLCRGLGPRALDLCRQLGIEVYVCQAGTVKEMFDLWKNDEINTAKLGDTCKEHRK